MTLAVVTVVSATIAAMGALSRFVVWLRSRPWRRCIACGHKKTMHGWYRTGSPTEPGLLRIRCDGGNCSCRRRRGAKRPAASVEILTQPCGDPAEHDIHIYETAQGRRRCYG